ncbi:MAG: heavy-metal-associated domain-containing protein [Comamonadaceae bacterium]|nr:heavy-metal-associated domain-containing protein [Comamonadaceae bacterium]
MHCGGCVSRVAKALKALDAGVAVTLEPPRATLQRGRRRFARRRSTPRWRRSASIGPALPALGAGGYST